MPTACLQSRKRQRGYALMMVVFFTALLLIATMAAAPSILVQGKREKEEEMIWRGKQYIRGVKLYYRKMGRFPTSVDDLTKPKIGSLRFMRQAYKDPMNQADGSWRLIYVGPSGQLIGSLKPPQSLKLPSSPGLGTPASSLAGNRPQSGGFNSPAGGSGSPTGTGSQTPGAGGTQTPPEAQASGSSGDASGTGSASAGSSDSMSTPQSITPTESSTIIGGNIIGVGSKIKSPSVIIYEKAKNYRLFEFIWDPSKDVAIGGQPGMQTGTGLGQNPAGQSGFSSPGGSFAQPPASAPPATPPLEPGQTAPPQSPQNP